MIPLCRYAKNEGANTTVRNKSSPIPTGSTRVERPTDRIFLFGRFYPPPSGSHIRCQFTSFVAGRESTRDGGLG
ncbi:hypothetical protein HAX54_030433 [Datura stramonium]|uniref:Uncharacterized protein n=1 Tax=Datura stramonium TaxID=4076 RepID=A0ABS8SB22_DATST|nr:hypothetical protein [Datura stramonium]